MNERLKQRAFELALEGLTQREAMGRLGLENLNTPMVEIGQAVAYAYLGGPKPQSTIRHNVDKVDSVAQQSDTLSTNKRKVRKAMIMLKVNYKRADEDAVTDCLTDLQHYCHAKGVDYLTCEARAQQHFMDETTVGGEHV
jgi:hypothetical protein